MTRTIQTVISFFLLCVFAIGVTPKQVLHDVLTHHQHIPIKEKGGATVGKDRYNCDEENLVAESPFIGQEFNPIPLLLSCFDAKTSIFFSSYSFLHRFFFELRGPPVLS